jgi:hypothetical protein
MGERLQVIKEKQTESFWTDHIKKGRTERLKIWEIDKFFKCPIVGACLTYAEQKHLLKKCGICTKNKTPYDIHEILVASCDTENRLSQKFENKLNQKFGKMSSILFEMDQEAFMEHWHGCFDAGDYHEALWTAASRPDLNIENRREIFGMVHMGMHWNGEQRTICVEKIAGIEKREAIMRHKMEKMADERKGMEKINRQQQKNNKSLEIRLKTMVEEKNLLACRLEKLESKSRVAELEQMAAQLQTQRDELLGTIEDQNRQINKLSKENQRLSEAFDQLMAANTQLQKSMLESIRNMHKLNTCNENCAAFDLCKKRVLIVGGIARMETLYRQLIESSGGVFEYHEGHMKGGSKELESSLKRSDIVLCPVNCNSHAACTMVKNLGKKHNKPVHMLPNFSLNIVSQVIRDCGSSAFSGSAN